MENNEALNCPCCDGKPKYCISGNINPPSHWYYIMCYDCGLESGKFKTNQEAIKSWNTRASVNTEKLIAEIEAYQRKQDTTIGYIIAGGVLEIIRKHSEPVSGGMDSKYANLGQYWETAPKAKQPAPADDTLREALERIKKRNEDFVDGFIADDNNEIPEDGELDRYNDWKDAAEALSQPAKPAMTREELVVLLQNTLNDINRPDNKFEAVITALFEAGVLNVRAE